MLETLTSFDSVFRDTARSTIDSAIDFDDTSEVKSLVPTCMRKWSDSSLINSFFLLRGENFLHILYNFLSSWTSPNHSQQTFAGLQIVFILTIFCLPKRLEDALQVRLEDVLETSHMTS